MKHIKQQFLTLLFLAASFTTFAQIGIGTTTPDASAALDVVSTTQGFLPPRMDTTQRDAISNLTAGLTIFNTTTKCLQWFDGSLWIDACGGDLELVNDCDTNGFTGAYVGGVALSGASFSVTITNNSIGDATISFQNSDVTLSGTALGSVTVSSTSPTSATLSAGQSQLVTYNLTGTPTAGTLKADWSKLTLSCTKTKTVSNGSNGNATFTLPAKVTIVSVLDGIPLVDIQGVADNTANQFIVNVPYTSGVGSYDAYTSAVVNSAAGTGEGGDANGFTISYPAGTFSATGTIPVTLTVDGDGVFYAKRQLFGVSATIATLDFQVNSISMGNVILEVHGGEAACSVKVSPTLANSKRFLCHNLGADTSLDPHVPVVGLQGAYIQWGRRGPNTTGDASVDWQTAANTSNFAAAPTAANANDGMISGWSTTAASDGAWNSGTEAAPVKTANDPCPTGYRVPTRMEWKAVDDNNTVSRTGTFSSSHTNYGVALHYGPDASTKLLTLPAAGDRSIVGGRLSNRGSDGSYWSSTEFGGSAADALTFSSSNVNPEDGNARISGFSVRCIAE